MDKAVQRLNGLAIPTPDETGGELLLAAPSGGIPEQPQLVRWLVLSD
jgi:hypothetical protein